MDDADPHSERHQNQARKRGLFRVAVPHGAFAWGVLDSLLEDGRVSIEGIVGTSAGAMNAVVTARRTRGRRERGGSCSSPKILAERGGKGACSAM